jgi:hypothetical protein
MSRNGKRRKKKGKKKEDTSLLYVWDPGSLSKVTFVD